ncbi:hypothetical protein VE01_01140 [Pseudogymnoascus verrucosus]|uniref:Glycosyl hydrolase family 32 N-terminal domain-containing protein n=1 Tax=Pseudogymnoascus verrucosus TaxID=342668 RepID=A0A1B8GXQ0_9PEZI|nr:uncharacterized protein VE01_01140 [Pseudogymnoascus verrucosus]OBU00608.1 hypothetical protein VE01_01140 [Pseudogymnoascus verrucosus]
MTVDTSNLHHDLHFVSSKGARPPISVNSNLYLFAISCTTATDARPSYHVTPELNWMNDPQRPFFLGEEWHMCYLFNADFNEANPNAGGGTEWYHVTSTDLIHWTRRGVAIEKYKPNQNGIYLGDIETGSAVIDTYNTAGFGLNAVIALVT